MPAARQTIQPLCIATILLLGPTAGAQDAYTDANGRTWRQVVGTTGLTWNQAASICPGHGSPCEGVVDGVDLTGWIWASDQEVLSLFAEFAPAVTTTGAVGGPDYTLAGLSFTNVFIPTSSTYTVVGGFFSLSGWSSTSHMDGASVPAVAASYNPHNASFSVNTTAPASSESNLRGLWLFRPACPVDLAAPTGTLTFADITAFLSAFDSGLGTADLAAPFGELTFADISAFLQGFVAGCP